MPKIKQNASGIVELIHAPGDSLDYSFDRTSWLSAGETIITSTWDIQPSTSIALSNAQIVAGVVTTVVTGGTLNKAYRLNNTVTTSSGKIDTRTLYIICEYKGM